MLLYLAFQPERLSRRATAALADDGRRATVSAVSLYEIAFKVQLGKLDFARPLTDDPWPMLASMGFALLPVTPAHALRAGLLAMRHRDPFDRLLLAQAIVENLALVSRDRAFDETGAVRIW